MAKQEQKAPPKKANVRVKKKIVRNVPSGIVHVKATFNNTIVAITDLAGNARDAMTLGMRECEVNLSGPGAGRESAVRGLQSAGLVVSIIRDTTPVPHNGCRPRKRRRV